MISIQDAYRPFMRHWRTARMRLLHETFRLTAETRVLDVGGTAFNWGLAPVRPRLTLLNLQPRPAGLAADIDYVQGDARHLDGMEDASFDIVYSNSVIEHLGVLENQEAMAGEVRRVGRGYFVQTPHAYFPVEPHLLTPFIHYLPRNMRRRLLRHATVWGLIAKPSPAQCDAFIDEVRLLDGAEMRLLFPDATIHTERFLGLPKSIVAMRVPGTI
jgi:hypothetical protein